MVDLRTRIIITLVALLGLLLGGYGLHRDGYHAGYGQRTLEYQAEQTAAEQAARDVETRQIQQTLESINARTHTQQINQVAFDRVRSERDGLRNDLARLTRDLPAPTANACAADLATSRELLAELGKGIERLAGTAGDIAKAADGHAADSMMYQEAWPK